MSVQEEKLMKVAPRSALVIWADLNPILTGLRECPTLASCSGVDGSAFDRPGYLFKNAEPLTCKYGLRETESNGLAINAFFIYLLIWP